MSGKYEMNFLDVASKLDAMTESCGEITNLAKRVVDESDSHAVKGIAQKISDVISNENNSKEIKQFAKALKNNLIE